MSRPEFDARDGEILAAREALVNRLSGPRIGDFVRLADGRMMRFSYDLGDALQVSASGSFHLCRSGHASFSGGLEPPIDKERIVGTGELFPGEFWFFHHDYAAAHNGVTALIPCRVYREMAALKS